MFRVAFEFGNVKRGNQLICIVGRGGLWGHREFALKVGHGRIFRTRTSTAEAFPSLALSLARQLILEPEACRLGLPGADPASSWAAGLPSCDTGRMDVASTMEAEEEGLRDRRAVVVVCGPRGGW